MIQISSGMTQFVRWFPPVSVIVAGFTALYLYFIDLREFAFALSGAVAVIALLIFLVYGRFVWDVTVDGNRVVLKKSGKAIETSAENIRRVELFPDLLFRGQVPQYELIFREPVQGFNSVRFYPTDAGKKWLNDVAAGMRPPAPRHTRR